MTKYYKSWIDQDIKCHPPGVNTQPFDLSDMTQACIGQEPASEACRRLRVWDCRQTDGIQSLAATLTGVTSLNLYISGWEW